MWAVWRLTCLKVSSCQSLSRSTRTAIPSPRRYRLSLTYEIQSDDGIPIRIATGQTVTCSINDTDDWCLPSAALPPSTVLPAVLPAPPPASPIAALLLWFTGSPNTSWRPSSSANPVPYRTGRTPGWSAASLLAISLQRLLAISLQRRSYSEEASSAAASLQLVEISSQYIYVYIYIYMYIYICMIYIFIYIYMEVYNKKWFCVWQPSVAFSKLSVKAIRYYNQLQSITDQVCR